MSVLRTDALLVGENIFFIKSLEESDPRKPSTKTIIWDLMYFDTTFEISSMNHLFQLLRLIFRYLIIILNSRKPLTSLSLSLYLSIYLSNYLPIYLCLSIIIYASLSFEQIPAKNLGRVVRSVEDCVAASTEVSMILDEEWIDPYGTSRNRQWFNYGQVIFRYELAFHPLTKVKDTEPRVVHERRDRRQSLIGSLTILTLGPELDKDIFSNCRKWTRKRSGVEARDPLNVI